VADDDRGVLTGGSEALGEKQFAVERHAAVDIERDLPGADALGEPRAVSVF